MNNKLKLSHSALNKYMECGEAYKQHYVNRLVSKYKGGALYFGSALDLAFNELLLGKDVDIAKQTFLKNWEKGRDNENGFILLKENEDIVYGSSDFDKDLLDERELKEFDEKRYKEIAELKSQKGWSNLDSKDRKYYNKMNWLSLKAKGLLMTQAYNDDIMPYFKEVLAIQQYVKLENADKDSIIGYIDLIVRLKDGRVAVIDNKTSGMEYDSDAVTKSPQLSIYKTILNEKAHDENDEWEHFIDVAGFAVLNKNVEKNIKKTCLACKFKAEKGSTHKTCYNEINGRRCGGEWDRKVTFKINHQFILDEIPERVQNMVLENVNTINHSIKSGIYTKNFNSCKTRWGGFCPYYQKCWMGKDDELVQLPKKEEK